MESFVFKASVDSSIIIAENKIPDGDDIVKYAQATQKEHIIGIDRLLSFAQISKKLSSLKQSWVFKDKNEMSILEKMNLIETKLGGMYEICGGIKTGCDEAFIIDNVTRMSLIKEDSNSINLIKPWYRGRDIQKWFTSPELYIIYIPQNEINIELFPAIKNHLKRYKEQLEKRATKQNWFELQQPQKRFTKLFEEKKIIYSEIALGMRALCDHGKAYGTMKMFFIPYNPIVLSN